MNREIADTAALQQEIRELRAEVERLSRVRDQLLMNWERLPHGVRSEAGGDPYVLDDDADEARAFDDFYHAYDGVHAKTRKFLLG